MKSLFLKIYMYFPVIVLVLGVIYVFTAPDVYRYPCQDPENWELLECNPPICEATGACTKDLIAGDDDITAQIEKMKAAEEALGIQQMKDAEASDMDTSAVDTTNSGE